MRRTSPSLITMVLTLLAISIAASGAAALRSIGMLTPSATPSSESATFNAPEGGFGIRCRGRFRATFEEHIRKSRGSHVGFVNFAGATSCTTEAGEATVIFLERELPWEMRYQSFGGTLPNIQYMLANIAQLEFLIRISVLGVIVRACLYRAEAEALVKIEGIGWEYLLEAEARLVTTLNGSCPGEIKLSGRYPVVERLRMALL